MIVRRVRGILVTDALSAAAWAVLGAVIGALLLLVPNLEVVTEPPVPGGAVGACALAGAIMGGASGLAFAILLAGAERGQRLEALRTSRVGAWGALASGVAVGLFALSAGLRTAAVVGLLAAILGAASAVCALALARRAPLPRPIP